MNRFALLVFLLLSLPGSVRSFASDGIVVPSYQRFRADHLNSVDAGRLLISELNCQSCHGSFTGQVFPPRQAPILTRIGERTNAEYLQKYIHDPQAFKPGTSMPGIATVKSNVAMAEAITAFLTQRTTWRQAGVSVGAIRRGEALFHSVGCAACHGDRRELAAIEAIRKGLTPPPENDATRERRHQRTTTTMRKKTCRQSLRPMIPVIRRLISSCHWEGRGEIYRVSDAWSDDPAAMTFELFAQGLHEILGLSYKDGWLYATQRCEVTRLRDTGDDGLADDFETFNDGWSIAGDYHEYAFGSPFDKDGYMWVTLCLTGSFNSDCPWRGWALRIDEVGNMIPTCSGIRSPGGIGFNAEGDVFYTDNQGPWNGTCSLKWLRPGSFQGHPGGNRWFALTEGGKDSSPQEPLSGSRIMTEADKIPEFEPPVILFPYQKMGQSASGIACDVSQGKFGPFENQFFVGDATHSTVMRCFVERINGHYQGACFPFREGISSGTLALRMTDDGTLFVGGTNRGWGSRGTKPFSLERLRWSENMPFEILEMRARPDSFELTFTEPVDSEIARRPESWTMETYSYIFQSSYGSPEVDHTKPVITQIDVADDSRSVRLRIDGLQRGHVHELHADGLRSAAGTSLLHPMAYYTLNYIP